VSKWRTMDAHDPDLHDGISPSASQNGQHADDVSHMESSSVSLDASLNSSLNISLANSSPLSEGSNSKPATSAATNESVTTIVDFALEKIKVREAEWRDAWLQVELRNHKIREAEKANLKAIFAAKRTK
jgi:hypothetical protein